MKTELTLCIAYCTALTAILLPRSVTASVPPALRVEFSGCAQVLDGPVCVMPDDTALRLWIFAPAGQTLRVQADNRAIRTAASETVQNGDIYDLTLPVDTQHLVVVTGAQRWSLALVTDTLPPVIVDARALNRAGQFAQVRDTLEAALPALPDKWRGVTLRMIGQAHRNVGNQEEAKRNLEKALAADLQAGRRSDALKSSMLLAFMQIESGHDYARARGFLNAVLPVSDGDAQSAYYVDYYLGLIAYNAGDARGALEHLGRAAEQAARMGNDAQRSYAVSLLAVQFQQIGRRELARDLLTTWVDALPGDVSPCDRALHLTNLVWAQLLMLEAGQVTDDPTPLALEAYRVTRAHCSAKERMNALTNLALARLHADKPEEAADYIVRAREETDTPRVRTVLWLLDVEARAALAQGDTAHALASYLKLENLANATLSPTARWRAQVGKARVQRAMGDVDTAIASFAAADNLLDDDIFAVPLDAGRETLLTAREWATREHMALLISAEKNQEAFALARRARGRVLRTLNLSERVASLGNAERAQWEQALSHYRALRDELDSLASDAWTLPADALAKLQTTNLERERSLDRIVDEAVTALGVTADPVQTKPAEDELLLVFHELPGGWAVFGHNGVQLEVRRPDCAMHTAEALATCLIEPFAGFLDIVSLVRILPAGALKNIDFHALSISGKPLIAHVAVVYGADLSGSKAAPARRGRALLVADGLGDLAAARSELKTVSGLLDAAHNWSSVVMSGDTARAADVLRALDGADIFHFAGHARFSGALGWDSELQLADSTSLSVTDIMTLHHAPRLVVLSGCETARTAAAVQPQSVGLANAFLLAGSDSVIATARPVRDEVARALVERFYREWVSGKTPHEALRTAQLSMLKTQADADWAAYRIIER